MTAPERITEVTLGEVHRGMTRVEERFDAFAEEMRGLLAENYVTRREWHGRALDAGRQMAALDERIDKANKRIDVIENRRPSWTAVVTAITGPLALFFTAAGLAWVLYVHY